MKSPDLRALVDSMTPGPWTENNPGTDPPGGTSPAADRMGIIALRNHAEALVDLQAAVAAWRDTACETQSAETDDYVIASMQDECAGDSHVESCPVEVAWQGVLEALATVEAIP